MIKKTQDSFLSNKPTLFASFLFVFVLSTGALFAQTAKITGIVLDEQNYSELIGVSVSIEGTTRGTITDFEGKFVLDKLTPGKYNLVFNYISYAKKVVPGIEIKAGEIKDIKVLLIESANELKEAVVKAQIKKETIEGMYLQQKKNITISDGISAEVIKRTPDANTGEAMKRISGATLQQGKFAVIRGLNDRYNAAMINGSPLPSTEPERRAFSFDLIPTNMVDQIVIIKTAAPNLPGDFAGGVIQVTTKETPSKPFLNVSLSSSYNSLSTGKDFKHYQGSSTDKWGFDNGTRQLPEGFPTTEELRNGSNLERAQKEADAGKLLNNNYALLNKTAMPNLSTQISGGKVFKIKKEELGIVFSTSYGNSNSFQQVDRNWYDFAKNTQFNYLDSLYENNVKVGALLNLSYQLKENHKFSFKNTFNLSGENATATRIGPSQAEGIFKQAYSYMYTQNKLMLSQLNGEHVFRDKEVKLNWEMSRAVTSRNMPDYKNVEYRGNEKENLTLGVINSANENAARLFTDLNERLHTAGASVALPMPIHANSTLKAGAFFQKKDRTFDARMMGFARARNSTFDAALLLLPIDQVFNYENMGLNGFKLNDITNASHQYDANSTLGAGYIMSESKFGKRLRAVYGLRYEAYNQQLVSATRNNEIVDINTDFNDWLPSMNVVYSINSKSNVRLSASKTVSRPELRELAPFSFYDFSTSSSLEGNDKLKRAVIKNLDMRYEIYPGAGQIFTAALFFKQFDNPIELVLANDISLGVIRRSFVNLPRATSYGGELDFRYDINKSWTMYGNFTYIKSVIEQGNNLNRWSENRPMQGQSPYVVNYGVLWNVEKYNLSVSALYNIYGDRIYNVGNTSYPDIYERARHLVDLQVTKSFLKKKLEAKLGVSDLLSRDLIFYMDYDKNNRYTEKDDNVIFRYKMPRTITAGVSYKF
jgi:outer membrane receptor protein involved in Fe transport